MLLFRVLRACKGAGGFIGQLREACRGVVGFNGRCSGARSGDGGFMLACISGRRGVIGFKVPMGGVLRAKKFALRGLMVGASAKKFALHAQNTPKSAFLRLLGELFRGSVGGGAAPGELFRGRAPGGPLLGGVFRGPAVEGSRWARVWHLDVGLVPPLDLGCATDPRSRAQDLGCASRRGCPKEPQVGDTRAPFRRIPAVSPKSASTPTSRGD